MFREKSSYFSYSPTPGMNTDTLPDSDTFRVVYQSAAKSKGKGEREVSIPSFKCVVLYFDSLLHEVYRNMIISDLGQL